MDYIKINGLTLPYGNDFTLQKSPNIVSEISTMSGDTISDVNGWKYADTKLQWDTLIENDLNNLLSVLTQPTGVLEFVDIDGEHTLDIIIKSRVNAKSRFHRNGQILWKNISLDISFPRCYHD